MESSGVKKAADILSRILDERGRENAERYSSLFGGWSRIAGDSLAEHSSIYEIKNHNLFVEVDHPGWMQLLLMNKNRIVKAVRAKYPNLQIRDMKIKVNLAYKENVSRGDVPGADTRKKSVSPSGKQSREAEKVDRIVSSVDSQELRQKLKRLFLRSIDKKKKCS